MPRLMLVYRREDSCHTTIPEITSALENEFGVESIHVSAIDRHSNAATLEADVLQHHALIVVIGRYGLNLLDEVGNRLVNNPDDPFVWAMETALEQDLFIAILLTDGATLPPKENLPETVQSYLEQAALTKHLPHLIADLHAEKWIVDRVQLADRDDLSGTKKRIRRWHPERWATYGVVGLVAVFLLRLLFGEEKAQTDDAVPQLVPQVRTAQFTLNLVPAQANQWPVAIRPLTAHNITQLDTLYRLNEQRYELLALSDNGQWLAASDGQQVVGWDLKLKVPAPLLLPIKTDQISVLAFRPDSQTLAFLSKNGAGGLWSIGAPIVQSLRGIPPQRGMQLVYRDEKWTWAKADTVQLGTNLVAERKRDTLMVRDSRLQGDVAHITIPELRAVVTSPARGLIAILTKSGTIALCAVQA